MTEIEWWVMKEKKSKQGLIFFEYFQPKEITKFVGGNKIRD